MAYLELVDVCILHSKMEDELFLTKNLLWIEIETKGSNIIEPGHEIVIQLSNKKKYKGTIVTTEIFRENNMIKGKIAVKRK